MKIALPQRRVSSRRLAAAEHVPGPTTKAFAALCRRYRAVAVLNLFERRGRRTFDASPVIDTDGRLLGVTRMMHIMDGPGFYERGYYAEGPARRHFLPDRRPDLYRRLGLLA